MEQTGEERLGREHTEAVSGGGEREVGCERVERDVDILRARPGDQSVMARQT